MKTLISQCFAFITNQCMHETVHVYKSHASYAIYYIHVSPRVHKKSEMTARSLSGYYSKFML